MEDSEKRKKRQQDREIQRRETMTSLESTVKSLISDYDGSWSVYVEELEYENQFSIKLI